MTPLTNDICPMFGNPCRHVSIERTSRPYTAIERDQRTGLYRPTGSGRKVVVLGEYCNDAGMWVRDMHYCPVRYSLTRATREPLKALVARKEKRDKARAERMAVGCVGWR
jgi:hypothetical protein